MTEERARISKAEYEAIAAEMAKDGARTPRQREVEACFGQDLPTVLGELHETCSSKSEMLRRINSTLDANGVSESVSRGTLYNWMDSLGVEERDVDGD